MGIIVVFAFAIEFVAAEKLIVAQHTGTVFQQTDDAVFFTEKENGVINIKLPGPRVQLNYLEYSNCFLCDKEIAIDQCEPQFIDFDDKILSFLNLSLVLRETDKVTEKMLFAEKIEQSTAARRKDFCFKQYHNQQFEMLYKQPTFAEMRSVTNNSEITYKDILDHKEKERNRYSEEQKAPGENSSKKISRTKRFEPITIAAILAVTAAAVGGAAWGSSGVEATAESLKNAENEILNLHAMIAEQSTTFEEFAEALKLNPKIVLAGNPDLPFDIRRDMATTQKGTFGSQLREINHISRHAFSQYTDFKKLVLTLQNQQLPLDTTFLLAVRAKCLSLQKVVDSSSKGFCNDFAFQLTKEDSSLKYRGVGLSFLDPLQKRIDSIIYSFQIAIPILDTRKLTQYDILNLGRFLRPTEIQRLKMPENGIITKSGNLHAISVN